MTVWPSVSGWPNRHAHQSSPQLWCCAGESRHRLPVCLGAQFDSVQANPDASLMQHQDWPQCSLGACAQKKSAMQWCSGKLFIFTTTTLTHIIGICDLFPVHSANRLRTAWPCILNTYFAHWQALLETHTAFILNCIALNRDPLIKTWSILSSKYAQYRNNLLHQKILKHNTLEISVNARLRKHFLNKTELNS